MAVSVGERLGMGRCIGMGGGSEAVRFRFHKFWGLQSGLGISCTSQDERRVIFTVVSAGRGVRRWPLWDECVEDACRKRVCDV